VEECVGCSQDPTTKRKLAGENFSNAKHPSGKILEKTPLLIEKDRKKCDRRAAG